MGITLGLQQCTITLVSDYKSEISLQHTVYSAILLLVDLLYNNLVKCERVGKNWTGRPGWCCFRTAIVANSLNAARNFAKLAFCNVIKLQNVAGLPTVRSQTIKSYFRK